MGLLLGGHDHRYCADQGWAARPCERPDGRGGGAGEANEQTRHRRVLVEVETPDLAELTEALAGGFVAGLAVLACKVIQEEQESNAMSEQGKYYESGQ